MLNLRGKPSELYPGYQRFFSRCSTEDTSDEKKRETAHEKPLAPRVCELWGNGKYRQNTSSTSFDMIAAQCFMKEIQSIFHKND